MIYIKRKLVFETKFTLGDDHFLLFFTLLSCKITVKPSSIIWRSLCTVLSEFSVGSNQFACTLFEFLFKYELDGGDTDKAEKVGFRVFDQGIKTSDQNKLALSAYYDKRYVLTDGIRISYLEF